MGGFGSGDHLTVRSWDKARGYSEPGFGAKSPEPAAEPHRIFMTFRMTRLHELRAGSESGLHNGVETFSGRIAFGEAREGHPRAGYVPEACQP